VRPAVANVPQFADDAPLGVAQCVLNDCIPLVPKQTKENLRIVEVGGLWLGTRAASGIVRQSGLPVVAEMRLEFAFDKRAQAGRQKVQSFAHTFTV